MSDQIDDRSAPARYAKWESNWALLSLLLMTLSWELSLVMLVGRWNYGDKWFNGVHGWVAIAVSVGLSVFHGHWGHKYLKAHFAKHRGAKMEISALQAVMVVAVILAGACFVVWLIDQGKRV